MGRQEIQTQRHGRKHVIRLVTVSSRSETYFWILLEEGSCFPYSLIAFGWIGQKIHSTSFCSTAKLFMSQIRVPLNNTEYKFKKSDFVMFLNVISLDWLAAPQSRRDLDITFLPFLTNPVSFRYLHSISVQCVHSQSSRDRFCWIWTDITGEFIKVGNDSALLSSSYLIRPPMFGLYVHTQKEGFVKISKNLARYRSKNNFVRSSK